MIVYLSVKQISFWNIISGQEYHAFFKSDFKFISKVILLYNSCIFHWLRYSYYSQFSLWINNVSIPVLKYSLVDVSPLSPDTLLNFVSYGEMPETLAIKAHRSRKHFILTALLFTEKSRRLFPVIMTVEFSASRWFHTPFIFRRWTIECGICPRTICTFEHNRYCGMFIEWF